MFKSLTIKNGVKHVNDTYNFNEGVTCIHGPNGHGKSLIQEYIRFCLFGVNALRGTAKENPQDLWCDLKLEIKGTEYVIGRGLKNATLSEVNGERIEGTTAVNKKIIEILGYGLSVFDMGNCAKQGEISSLGRMKPAERKAAVDQVLGMSAVSDLIKEIKQDKKDKNSYLEGLKYGLVEPVKPEAPETTMTKEEIESELESEKSKQFAYLKQESICKALVCEKPTWVGEQPVGDLSQEGVYKSLCIERNKILTQRHDCRFTLDELNSWYTASTLWEKYKEPELTLEECERYESDWRKHLNWISATKATCPKCGHEFAITGAEYAEEPKVKYQYIQDQKHLLLTKPTCERPQRLLTKEEYQDEMLGLKNRDRLLEIEDKLKVLECFDFDKLRAWDTYTKNLEKYSKYEEELNKFNAMEPYDLDNINRLSELKFELSMYYEKLKLFLSEKEKYDSKIKSILEIEEEIKEYDKEIEGLEKFRSEVKSQVTPSLSRIASEICDEITNGEISDVKIDEDFNILVEGRELRTFSGSEEAVANLAIRLALSCVLTRKVLNVFMGDEIDAAMDDERAERVCESLLKLKSEIDQIILISHHPIVGDNEIEIS